MTGQDVALVRRGIEDEWYRGDDSALDELVADDVVIHLPAPGDEIRGPAGIGRCVAALRGAFPGLRFTIEDPLAAGDRVVARWTARATLAGAFQGVPPPASGCA
jgi:predicted ester cyclase